MSRADAWTIRRAGAADLDAVEALERACFTLDAQSRRSLRYLLMRAHADVLLAVEADGTLLGDAVVLYRRGARVARLYSIATSRAARGRGVGTHLLAAGEAAAREKGCRALRAEVRVSNAASRGLFGRTGYREIGPLPAYYPGGEDGLRLEKPLS